MSIGRRKVKAKDRDQQILRGAEGRRAAGPDGEGTADSGSLGVSSVLKSTALHSHFMSSMVSSRLFCFFLLNLLLEMKTEEG